MHQQGDHALQVADVDPLAGGVRVLLGGADEHPVEWDAAAVEGSAVGGATPRDLALEGQTACLGEGKDTLQIGLTRQAAIAQRDGDAASAPNVLGVPGQVGDQGLGDERCLGQAAGAD